MGTPERTAGLTATQVPTPALVVDLDTFEANVAAMESLLHGTGKHVRPHVKTHRTPELARRQLGGHAVGVTCATVGEAEAMVASGIDEILLANEVVDREKIARLARLASDARITAVVDDAEPVRALSEAAHAAGVTIGVLVDVDIHLHRCGVESPGAAVGLAREVAASPRLRLDGIMGYEGRIRGPEEQRAAQAKRAYAVLAETKAAFVREGLPVDVVSAAGTSTIREAVADPTVTEIQAGVYALMEPELEATDLPFRCAVYIVGQVVSRHSDRIVLDIGRRAVGMEYGPPQPVGFEGGPIRVSDEHATIPMAGALPALGARLALRPAQIRTTFNLYDHVWASRSGQLIDRWPISARGRSS